jgi:protease-4
MHMRAATERSLRRWRATIAWLAALLALTGLALGAGIAAVRIAPAPGPVLAGTLVVLGLLALAVVVLGRVANRVPRRVLLVLDLTQPLADLAPGDLRARLRGRDRPGLREACATLERAAADERVAGLWCRIGRPAGGLADVQGLRDAVTAFRERGKFAVAFAETFGEPARGTTPYYLATAFDEVVLQPSGDVGLTGFGSEVTFVREALDRYGVTPQIDRRSEYKSAAERLTERAFTPAYREASGRIVEASLEQVIAGVSGGRRLDAAEVRALVDRAPLGAGEALEAGLVDRLGYRDEALGAARSRAGDGVRSLPLAEFARRTRRAAEPRRATTVALVLGVGAVTAGRSRPNPLTGWSMGADSVCAAIRQAVADERVSAILFRVDSPGGSYVASDAIWRETVRAREAGKPVVVSMGNVAGSGGYFVAMAADRIVAHPGTLTGSIGVVGGKVVLAGLLARLGVSSDEVHAGARALMWSNRREFAPSEWRWFQDWLDRVYADFTRKAAEGRGLDLAAIDAAARGRVWVGADALERGLVDILGGYPEALAQVRGLLGLAADAPLRVVPFPRRVPLLARLLGRGPAPEDDLDSGGRAGDLVPSPASDLGLTGGERALLMPEPWTFR